MSFCPFMSDTLGSDYGKYQYHPCVANCELRVSGKCSLRALAQSQQDITNVLKKQFKQN